MDTFVVRTAPTGLHAAEPDRFPPQQGPHRGARTTYLAALTWAFTLFSTLRVVSYLPTMWAIQASGDSSQHSLWTWGTWVGANLTMAAWLYEQNGRRIGRVVVVNLANAILCAATTAMIAVHRGWPF